MRNEDASCRDIEIILLNAPGTPPFRESAEPLIYDPQSRGRRPQLHPEMPVTWMLDEGDKKDEKAEGAPMPSIAQDLYKARTILIFGEINDKLAERVCAQLLAFSAKGDEDIRIVISSPGGHVESGDVIHDMIGFVKPRVKMIGSGWVAGATSGRTVGT